MGNPTQHTTHSHDRALGETNSTIGSRHDHIPPLFHCQHINLHAGLPGIFKYLTASLDEQVKKLRAQGRLDAGKSTLEKLEWTTETAQAGQEFKKNVDLALLKTFGVTNRTSEDIKWTGPIVYSDAMSPPLKYATAAEGYGILGILALGTLQLPEIGDSGSREIKSGHV